MSGTLKNIIVVVGVAIILYGCYIYFVGAPSVPDSDAELQKEELVTKTQVFIKRSTELKNASLATSFLTDPVFTSLQNISPSVSDQPVGRNDIFSTPQPVE